MQLEGAWTAAMELARQACLQLSGPVRWDSLGSAYYQLGELQRLRGEFTAAEQSYRKASEAGRPPEPGLALLRLAQGRRGVAVAALRRAVDETQEPPTRCRLLPAYVEVLIASGDVASARACADDLGRIAELLDAPYLRAVAASAAGAVLLAEGEPRSALPKLRAASSAWRELDAPYETARVRVQIGLACSALGDADTSAVELDGARRLFEHLGAKPDIQRLDALIRRPSDPTPGGLSTREVQVLRLVAAGKTNRAIAACPRRQSPATSTIASPRSACRPAPRPPPTRIGTNWSNGLDGDSGPVIALGVAACTELTIPSNGRLDRSTEAVPTRPT
jgi:ATP/maltotriose-dependent transcriptional regulator MalT